MKTLMYLILMLTHFSVVSNQSNNTNEILKEIEDFLYVKPSRSLLLLDKVKNSLSSEQMFHWHLLQVRAAVPTNQLDKLNKSIAVLIHEKNHPDFKENLPTILSALGIWLRKKSYYYEADISLKCALKYANTKKQTMMLINSRALVLWNSGNIKEAKALYIQVSKIAKEINNINYQSVVNNNLGLIAIEADELTLAKQFFKKALDNYQAIAKRSGEVTAAGNLLFIFVLLDELVNFQRLYPRIERMTAGYPNESKKAFLFWTYMGFKAKNNEKITTEELDKLTKTFHQLGTYRVKATVIKHLSPLFGLSFALEAQPKKVPFNQGWFKLVQSCQW